MLGSQAPTTSCSRAKPCRALNHSNVVYALSVFSPRKTLCHSPGSIGQRAHLLRCRSARREMQYACACACWGWLFCPHCTSNEGTRTVYQFAGFSLESVRPLLTGSLGHLHHFRVLKKINKFICKGIFSFEFTFWLNTMRTVIGLMCFQSADWRKTNAARWTHVNRDWKQCGTYEILLNMLALCLWLFPFEQCCRKWNLIYLL